MRQDWGSLEVLKRFYSKRYVTRAKTKTAFALRLNSLLRGDMTSIQNIEALTLSIHEIPVLLKTFA